MRSTRGQEDSAQQPSSALWIGALLGGGLLAVAAAIAETPAGPVSTGVVGLGTLAVAVAGFLAGRTSQRPLDDLTEGVRSERTLDEQSPARVTAAAEFARELERSRRYEHTFTIVKVVPRPQLSMAASAGGGWRGRVAASAIASRMRTRLRSVDRVWALRDQVYVLMPECDHAQAAHALRRVERVDPGLLRPGRIHLAAFPADGLTIPALLAALESPPSAQATSAPLERISEDI
ncbi:MAG: hypothetical protein ACRD0K_13725 [Egibacteraceae bacterium]